MSFGAGCPCHHRTERRRALLAWCRISARRCRRVHQLLPEGSAAQCDAPTGSLQNPDRFVPSGSTGGRRARTPSHEIERSAQHCWRRRGGIRCRRCVDSLPHRCRSGAPVPTPVPDHWGPSCALCVSSRQSQPVRRSRLCHIAATRAESRRLRSAGLAGEGTTAVRQPLQNSGQHVVASLHARTWGPGRTTPPVAPTSARHRHLSAMPNTGEALGSFHSPREVLTRSLRACHCRCTQTEPIYAGLPPMVPPALTPSPESTCRRSLPVPRRVRLSQTIQCHRPDGAAENIQARRAAGRAEMPRVGGVSRRRRPRHYSIEPKSWRQGRRMSRRAQHIGGGVHRRRRRSLAK